MPTARPNHRLPCPAVCTLPSHFPLRTHQPPRAPLIAAPRRPAQHSATCRPARLRLRLRPPAPSRGVRPAPPHRAARPEGGGAKGGGDVGWPGGGVEGGAGEGMGARPLPPPSAHLAPREAAADEVLGLGADLRAVRAREGRVAAAASPRARPEACRPCTNPRSPGHVSLIPKLPPLPLRPPASTSRARPPRPRPSAPLRTIGLAGKSTARGEAITRSRSMASWLMASP
jgi:hypothetical protein